MYQEGTLHCLPLGATAAPSKQFSLPLAFDVFGGLSPILSVVAIGRVLSVTRCLLSGLVFFTPTHGRRASLRCRKRQSRSFPSAHFRPPTLTDPQCRPRPGRPPIRWTRRSQPWPRRNHVAVKKGFSNSGPSSTYFLNPLPVVPLRGRSGISPPLSRIRRHILFLDYVCLLPFVIRDGQLKISFFVPLKMAVSLFFCSAYYIAQVLGSFFRVRVAGFELCYFR